MVAPIVLLAVLCAAMALSARALVPSLGRVAAQVFGGSIDIAPVAARLGSMAIFGLVLWVAVLVAAIVLLLLVRGRGATTETWGCGYAAPTARMQYTGRSFAELLAENLLPKVLRTRIAVKGPRAIFAEPARLSSDSTDPWTRSVYEPFVGNWARRFARLRFLQQGSLHVYLLYILVVVTGVLAWTSLRRWWGGA
jgi:hydrogenase-4 component B